MIPFLAIPMQMKLSGKYAERVKGIEGEALAKLIQKTLKELLTKLSEKDPVLILIEDLHWADASSIDVLASLFRLAAEHRLLFINVFRPRYEKTGDRIVKTVQDQYRDWYAELSLKALDSNQTETLVKNLLKIEGLPANIQRKIIDRSGRIRSLLKRLSGRS